MSVALMAFTPVIRFCSPAAPRHGRATARHKMVYGEYAKKRCFTADVEEEEVPERHPRLRHDWADRHTHVIDTVFARC